MMEGGYTDEVKAFGAVFGIMNIYGMPYFVIFFFDTTLANNLNFESTACDSGIARAA